MDLLFTIMKCHGWELAADGPLIAAVIIFLMSASGISSFVYFLIDLLVRNASKTSIVNTSFYLCEFSIFSISWFVTGTFSSNYCFSISIFFLIFFRYSRIWQRAL